MQPPIDNSRNMPDTEIIRPRPARPNGGRGHDRPNRRSSLIFGLVFMGLVVALAGTGIWLFRHLANNPVAGGKAPTVPATVQPKAGPTPQAAQSDPRPAESTPSPGQEAQKPDAEQALGAFLKAQSMLTEKGVSRWGGDLYADMTALSGQADKLLLARSYGASAETYTKAKTIADQLIRGMPETLQRSIKDGDAALAAGDSPLAREKFSLALMIAPDNPAAGKGLKRAESLDTVLRLVASGMDHENRNDVMSAARDYEKALALDPDFKAAAAGLERINKQVEERKFQRFMSEGLTALGKKDYSTARTKLTQAGKIRPGSQAAGDALAQLDQAVRLADIENLRRRAVDAETSEDWEPALALYLQVLKLDPNIRFARQGKERSLNQVQIAKRIDFFLNNPDFLALDPQLEKAQALVDEAVGVLPRGPGLAKRINRLTALVKAAKTPVRITILSDNLTEVSVYRVGKLGRFTLRDLNLRPGNYTVVGSRDGYRDVRQTVSVKLGEKSMQVTVICKVKV